MALSTGQKIGIGAAAALGTLWLVSRGSKSPTHAKSFYLPGETFRIWQGVPFTMKMPRGQYQALNPELQVMTQADYGNETHVQLLAIAAPSDYTIAAILSEIDHPDHLFRFTVQARKPV
jgi:hypothetical protein